MRAGKVQPGAAAFRAELVKIMPGYDWTVHKTVYNHHLEATGTQSSGFNRTSTLSVIRTEPTDGKVTYEVKSAGFGLKAKWLHKCGAPTLARALRHLQDHYEGMARIYAGHGADLAQGRCRKGGAA